MASDNPNSLSVDIYKEICTNIRVTDDISFKLLGTVPLASGIGSGALVILERSKLLEGNRYPAIVLVGLSAIGALITVGLFRWELRNIQKCRWLIARAASFETQILVKPNLQFGGMANEQDLSAKAIDEVCVPSLFKKPWGKTQAEKLIYLTTVGAWLLPLGIAMHKLF
jgi:hypothetical protein